MLPAPGRESPEQSLAIGLNARVTALTLLQCISGVAITTGLLVALTAPSRGPSFAIVSSLPGWPVVYGLILAAAGLVQLIGAARRWHVAGMVASLVIALWYAGFGLTFAVQWWEWVNGPQDTLDPSVYPTAVYVGLGVVHAIIGNLLRLNRRTIRALNAGPVVT